MLYPHNQQPFSDDTFRNPPCEYRGAPFWAWNGRLTDDELLRQIHILHDMGFGGFHMHVRTGMDTPYLTREFMDKIKLCIAEAKKLGMRAYLYDEDRWPSGSCGGLLTRGDNPGETREDNSLKFLLFTPKPYTDEDRKPQTWPLPGYGQRVMRHGNGHLLAVWDVVLDDDGRLVSAERAAEGDSPKGTLWYGYMEHATGDPWFNGGAYADTLRKETMGQFIESTYQKYADNVGEDFGKTVPSIFTDEPEFSFRTSLTAPNSKQDVFIPWTDSIEQQYEEKYGESLLDAVPRLFWESDEASPRWKYMNTVTDMFVDAFFRQIGDWCRDNGILFTGHVMNEPTLGSQSVYVGEAMRCYHDYDVPGIDMLCDNHEFTTAKQTASIVRQDGKEGMMSELYGVTGWEYDFRGHKLQGDWQAALGVTLRVPHLSWVTMKGEAKRDYPASLNYQSPWWREYSLVENHFARVNTAMTRGKAVVNVAVVHPIESYWLHMGDETTTSGIRSQMEKQFAELTETLLLSTVDFDYISENELPRQCPVGGNPLNVGQMSYGCVIVPPVTTLRLSTVERLTAFAENGGTLVLLGDCPECVDGVKQQSRQVERLYSLGKKVIFSPSSILDAVEPFRQVEIRENSGIRTENLLCQLREDEGGRWLFIARGKNPESPDVDTDGDKTFTVKGEWSGKIYDTITGEIYPLPVTYRGGNTVFTRHWHQHDSLLIRLEKGRSGENIDTASENEENWLAGDTLMGQVNCRRDEPNMLLLDMAEYSFDGSGFFRREELLRIDNICREELGIAPRLKETMQPYMLAEKECTHRVTLRFVINSTCTVEGVSLALEDLDTAEITWNGQSVSPKSTGWFVDKAIETVALGNIHPGENILTVTQPIGERTNMENMFLLGDFSVEVHGAECVITPWTGKVGFGTYTNQGMPFYTGNLTYDMPVTCQGDFTVRVPMWRGSLVKVSLDGEDVGRIAFSPYTLHVKAAGGEHTLSITLMGTRVNGFGPIHHTPGIKYYQSPNAWRTAGDLWKYEYQLTDAGIMTSPELMGAEFSVENRLPQSSHTFETVVERS